MPAYFAASDVLIVSLTDSPICELAVPEKFQTHLTTGESIFCIMKGELRNMVKQYGLGICADSGDIDDIAAGFSRFRYTSQDEYAAYGKRMNVVLNDLFSRDKIIQGMTSLVSPAGKVQG